MQLAIPENLASLDYQVELVLLGQWVCRGQRVTLGFQAQDHLGNQVTMVTKACLAQLGLEAHKVQLVSQVPLACQVSAKQENLELQVAEEPLVPQEPSVRKESQALLALLVIQVLLALSAQLVHKVQEDFKVSQAHRDSKGTTV